MKTQHYYLIIKSGSEAGDIEREVEASSLDEAIGYFMEELKYYDWPEKLIRGNIACDKCMNTTNSEECDHEPV